MNSRRPRGPFPHGLYLITPDDDDTARLVSRVTAVLPHAALLQYRNKSSDKTLRRNQLQVLLPLCRMLGVPLVVNDDWRLAIELDADGAHLGERDGDLGLVRAVVREDFILGASCYDDPALADAAAAAGADYLAFGAFHPSPTKPGARRADVGLLRDARRHGLPLVAIGGIKPDNVAMLVDAGADLVAVISGVFDAIDPVAAAQAYAQCFAPRPASKDAP